jgi:hypothetical protein
VAEEDEAKVKVELELPQSAVSIEHEEKGGSTPSEADDESLVKKATGYEAAEILKAPTSPPEPKKVHKPRPSQIRVIILGLAIVLMGLVIAGLVGWRFGLAAALMGAAFVAVGAFVRI